MPEVPLLVFGASFAIYTLAIVGVGLFSARYAKRSDEDYFLAGRSLGPILAALSASASSESGWVTLGLVGWAYGSGVSAFWIIPGCLVGVLLNWLVIAPRLRRRAGDLDALTLPDFFAFHYRERIPVLRVLSVIVILTAMLLYVAAQFAAAGKAFSVAFDLDPWIGVVGGAAVVLIYTVTGGFRAVCWTDFLQSLLMVGALVIFPLWLLLDGDGIAGLRAGLVAADPTGEAGLLDFIPTSAKATTSTMLGFLLGSGALGINFGYPGQPHVIIRFMALRQERAARLGAVIAATWSILVFAGAVTIGLLARGIAAQGAEWTATLDADGEVGLIVSAMYLLPGVVSGLVLAAVLAAICSTADSQLIVAASAAANDLYARIAARARDRSHVLINKITVLGLTMLAVGVVLLPGEIKVYSFVLEYGWAILGAAFGPQVLLTLLWRRATWAGCLAGMLTGFVVAGLWKAIADNQITIGETTVQVYNLPLAFIAALLINVLVSLVTTPPVADEVPS